ncbi:MAG: RNA polymerase sigma factor [Planctomycetes bacterium]|nr:RNA polymerase sigma factor [Planctomycetota bacterium]
MSQTPENETLQENLQRAAEGDEDAWRDIVETYSYRVFGLIRAQCGNNELAEEITQSTFCTVVMKIGQYTEVGRFEAWLFRIAMNRLRDEMRRRKRQARPVEDEVLTSLAGGIGPDEDIHSDADSEQLANLRQAMARLSESDLKVIQMRHYGGLSFAQIAQVLNQPIGTVLARQHRALKKLRELLGPNDVDS